MNYYIIFTPNISGIGGAELYIKNKCLYLKQNNWEPIIITSSNEDIKINELQSINTLSIKELTNPIYYYSESQKNKILNKITSWINAIKDKSSQILIESHNLYPCTWAEKVSEIYKTVNIVYFLLESDIFKLNPTYYKFILHKITQNQFITVSNRSAEVMFGQNIKNNIPYVNVPFSLKEFQKNNESEIKKIFDEVEKDSIVLLTVSRLEKPYIKTLINDVYNLADKVDQKICLIIVGDSSIKGLLENYIKEYESNNTRVMIKFTGYIYPLFEELFNKSNLFIGMGTSIINAASVGCPAICVDPRNNMSSGVFGIDLDNFAYSNTISETSLSDEISRLLEDNDLMSKASINSKLIFNKEYDFDSVMKKFMNIVYEQLDNNDNKYFEFKNKFGGIKELLRYLFTKSIGIEYYNNFAKTIKNLIEK